MTPDSAVCFVERGPVATITLSRPERRNAFDPLMVESLTRSFLRLGNSADVRVVVLAGQGRAFSAGADLEHMRSVAGFSAAENVADAEKLADLFTSIRECPKPVVARVQGAAFGGGAGLVAASDIAIAESEALFAFPEAHLGLAPAVVAPYVLSRVGAAAARVLFLTGEPIRAVEARAIGLVDRVVAPEDLDDAVGDTVRSLLEGGPLALATIKRLVAFVEQHGAGARADLAQTLAGLRSSAEGAEGISAFLERRRPAWSAEAPDPGQAGAAAIQGRGWTERTE